MGFLDDVLGKAREAVGGGGGEQSALIDGVLGLLSGGGSGGGLDGLVRTLQGKGLGEIVSSWVGTGENLPISADQLRNGLGSDLVAQLAAKAGIPGDVATSKLADLLPSLVDTLTPGGSIPGPDALQKGLDALRSTLSKG